MKKYRYQFLVIFAVAVILAGIGWWLNSRLENASFSVWNPSTLDNVFRVESWGILPKLWPIALAGALIGGFIVLFIISVLLPLAADVDHAKEIDELTFALEEAVKLAKLYQ